MYLYMRKIEVIKKTIDMTAFKQIFFLGLMISIFMLFINLFTFLFDSNLINCKKAVKGNDLVKARIPEINYITSRLQSRKGDYYYYILKIQPNSKLFKKTYIYVEYNYIKKNIVDLAFIDSYGDKCKYYGKVNTKYRCQ